MTTHEIEIAMAKHLGYLRNIIVYNVRGVITHECDLLSVTPAGNATEIEIKVTKHDLINDKLKWHGHRSDKIKYLYFAIPESLLPYEEHIPARAGIFVLRRNKYYKTKFHITKYRKAETNKTARKFTAAEMVKLGHLAAMRIWVLKEKLIYNMGLKYVYKN